jgi:hypothetical protein
MKPKHIPRLMAIYPNIIFIMHALTYHKLELVLETTFLYSLTCLTPAQQTIKYSWISLIDITDTVHLMKWQQCDTNKHTSPIVMHMVTLNYLSHTHTHTHQFNLLCVTHVNHSLIKSLSILSKHYSLTL